MEKIIVITGSTRGIGFGLAAEFLARGCGVVISGRSQESVDAAFSQLAERFPEDRIWGVPCDVTDSEQVERLWQAAVNHFGRVDLWINNAGVNHPQAKLWEQPVARVNAVVDTNLKGVIFGSQTALRGMLAQGFGALYNMAGLGSDGRMIPGLALYGTTKYALTYLTKSLVAETEGTPVLVGIISPGMVATDMLLSEQERRAPDWQKQKRLMNILTDRVETVTPWLVDQMLTNHQHGARIRWLTPAKVAWRFLTAPFRPRNVIE